MSKNEENFRSLMVLAQKGDNDAYRDLLGELSSFLVNYLRRRVFNSTEAEEVIQETLMAIHKSRHTYDDTKSFMSWFLSIAEYKAIDSIRSVTKRSREMSFEEMHEGLSYPFFDEQTFDFDRAFGKLGKKEQEIIRLLKIDGFKAAEVACKMNLTEANVKVIAHRAYKNLQICLGVKFENN